ncbi:hypothetical protein L195_g058641, partial [Trifolium pratense]
ACNTAAKVIVDRSFVFSKAVIDASLFHFLQFEFPHQVQHLHASSPLIPCVFFLQIVPDGLGCFERHDSAEELHNPLPRLPKGPKLL